MKIFYLTTLSIFFAVTTWSQNLLVNGEITDADTLMILVKSMDNCDTIFTNDGQFTYSKQLLNPELISIVCIRNKQSIEAIKEGNERKMRNISDGVYKELFLEAGKVIIHTSFANFDNENAWIFPHNTWDKYNEFQERFQPLVKMARSIIDSSFSTKRTEPEKELCRNFYQRIVEIENETAEKFVEENSNNVVGAYVLYRYCRIENFYRLDSIYKLFDSTLQATAYLKNIKDKITALSKLEKGKQVPIIYAKTNEGKTISLNDFKNKYVVLDFWGSWCTPCIRSFPKMKEYYVKYKDSLEIIGISCKDTEVAWRNAIKKHNVNWVQVFNNEGNNDLAVLYNVEAYPTKILIDKEGNLIDVFKGESKEFYQKLDALLKN